jgi:ribosomal protein S18 acetylase RimI-like enzyme
MTAKTEMKPFKMRPLEARDIPRVAFFEAEIAKVSFPDDPITDLGFYENKLKKIIGDSNASGMVAEDESGVVGWAHVSIRRNFITKEAYGDFHSIYIDASQRGTGVVAALAKTVFDFCKKHRLGHVVFRTRATNEPMKAVLARFGFVPTQIYYERPITDRD